MQYTVTRFYSLGQGEFDGRFDFFAEQRNYEVVASLSLLNRRIQTDLEIGGKIGENRWKIGENRWNFYIMKKKTENM